MSDSSQEPTMEEILASIRRIISEDDAPEANASPPPPPPPPEEPPAASAAEELPIPDLDDEPLADFDASDELELTERVESHGDLDVYSPPPEPPPIAPVSEASPDLGELVSAPAAAAAAAAFGRLNGSMLMPAHGRTLEDVVRELLRPMLQNWLDENLPTIVQRAVDAEVTRIARGG